MWMQILQIFCPVISTWLSYKSNLRWTGAENLYSRKGLKTVKFRVEPRVQTQPFVYSPHGIWSRNLLWICGTGIGAWQWTRCVRSTLCAGAARPGAAAAGAALCCAPHTRPQGGRRTLARHPRPPLFCPSEVVTSYFPTCQSAAKVRKQRKNTFVWLITPISIRKLGKWPEVK